MKQLNNYLFLLLIAITSITLSNFLYSQEKDDEILLFEDLLLQEISGDAKYDEIIKQSSNSITIITADDINKKGFMSFNDILDYVSDFCMSSDLLWNYLGVRGLPFNSSYGSRVAVMIDDNLLADYVFSSLTNGGVLEISLEFIERIEFISLNPSFNYGSNGMLGAVNIVTKHGKDFNGGVVKAGTIFGGETCFEISLGNRWMSGLDIMFSYRGTYNPGSDIYFEEYDENSIYGDINSQFYNNRAANGGIANKKNKSYGNVFYLSAEYNNFTLTAMQTLSNKHYPSAPYGTIFNDPEAKVNMAFTNIVLLYNWKTNLFGMSHNFKPKFQYTRSESELYYNYDEEDEEGNSYIWSNIETPIFSGLRFELIDHIEVTNNSYITASINYLTTLDYDLKFTEGINYNYDTEAKNILDPLKLFNAHMVYRNELNNWFSFFGGIKYENAIDNKYNSVILPRIGVIFDIGYNSIIKGLFGRTARRSSGYEDYLAATLKIDHTTNDTTFVVNNLDYEISQTFELIYIYRVPKFLVNISLFYNDIRNFIYEKEIDLDVITIPDPSYPFLKVNAPNDISIKNYGITISAKYKTEFGLELLIGNTYSILNTNIEDNDFLLRDVELGSYRNLLIYGISYELIDFLYINLIGRYEANVRTIDRTPEEILGIKYVPDAHKINMSIVYRPMYKQNNLQFLNNFYAALSFKNILNKIDYYPVSTNFGAVTKVPRNNGYSIGFSLGYKF